MATKQMWLWVPRVLSDTAKVTWMPGGIRIMRALMATEEHTMPWPPPCPLPQPIAEATINIEVGTLVAVALL